MTFCENRKIQIYALPQIKNLIALEGNFAIILDLAAQNDAEALKDSDISSVSASNSKFLAADLNSPFLKEADHCTTTPEGLNASSLDLFFCQSGGFLSSP